MNKTLVGILAFALPVYMVFFLVFFFSLFFSIFKAATSNPPVAPAFPFLTFFLFFPIHMLFVFINMGLIAYLIYNVFHNKKVAQDQRVIWIILLLFFSIFTAPIYWYKFIR